MVQGLNTAQGNQMKNTAAPAQNNKAAIIQDNAEHATVDNQENVEPDNMKEVGELNYHDKNIIYCLQPLKNINILKTTMVTYCR